jgi:HK97 gp10 family phage protein
MTDTFKIDSKELDRIIGALDGNKEKAGRVIGFELEAEAKRRAPRDTSAMANSIYTVTKKYDGYSQASGAARQANKDAETNQHPRPSGNVLARVGPCVNYAVFVEMGTSRMAAQPFLYPAAEVVANKINDGSYWKVLIE